MLENIGIYSCNPFCLTQVSYLRKKTSQKLESFYSVAQDNHRVFHKKV